MEIRCKNTTKYYIFVGNFYQQLFKYFVMTRTELKEKLTQPTAESRRLYRLYPTLYRDLILWDDYLRLIAINRQKKYRAAKNYARYDITEEYAISEKTFYAIRRTLRELCSDV